MPDTEDLLDDAMTQLRTARQELKGVYRERAHLVAVLAAMLPGTLSYSDPDTPDWPVLTLDAGAGGEGGQLSWHIAPDDLDLFGHLPVTAEGLAWDGHSTDEKYERMREMTAVVAEMMSMLKLSGLPDLFAALDGVHEPEPEHTSPAPASEPVVEQLLAPAPLPKRTSRAKKAGA